jgi:hypothetical protein
MGEKGWTDVCSIMKVSFAQAKGVNGRERKKRLRCAKLLGAVWKFGYSGVALRWALGCER